MGPFAGKSILCLLAGVAMALAACGGSGGSQGTGSGNILTTPTVTVTPDTNSISVGLPLPVTVTLSGRSGTPTGTITLASGSYTSPAATLSGGRAAIIVEAGKLRVGPNTLTANYTPGSGSASTYAASTGSTLVSVAVATPTLNITPASPSITTSQVLSVTVAVTGFGGGATPTGSVALTAGTYTSGATTLSGGSATISVPAGSMAAGSATLTATYSPDDAGSAMYAAASNTATVTVIAQSTVAVNESLAVAPVTDQLLGMNLATWYDVAGNSPAINTAFAAAGIKAIRWPGGSWSDAYHWGDVSGAPTRCANPKSPGDTTWPGFGTFAAFISSIAKTGKYDLALTANYGSNTACNAGGDPQEAADWAAEAVKEGWPASYMTVGNEEYGATWELDFHAKPNDPTTYATEVSRSGGYYDLIKKASPTTRVGVVVDAGATTPGWDSTVLSRAKGSYDFVEYHYYPQAPASENDTYLVHQGAQDLAKSVKALRSELQSAGAPAATPIYVGEIGSVYTLPGKQSWSITQGLYAGQALGEMMNAGVSRLTWWIGFGNCDEGSNGIALGNMSPLLYGWQSFGAYNVFSDGPSDGPCGVGSGPIGTMSPTARAFQLFSNLAVTGEHALSTTVTGDLTNIRAYSATHSGGTALFLFNLNPTEKLPVTVTFSASTHSSGVTVITYDKAIYDQSNAASPVWADLQTTDLGAQSLPLALTLTPWSMNVVILK